MAWILSKVCVVCCTQILANDKKKIMKNVPQSILCCEHEQKAIEELPLVCIVHCEIERNIYIKYQKY